MLAYQPEEFIEEALSHPLERFTSHTITSPEGLRDELARIRKLGYAVNRGEFTEHGAGVAVVIFDSRGEAIAALSSGGRNTDAEFAQAEALIPTLRRVADNISAMLGHGSGG
jgi:DNA-binding IclR family transcriptional regulator